MVSDIVKIRDRYGVYTDRLPEEILHEKTEPDLESIKNEMFSIMEKDYESLTTLIQRTSKNAYLNKMEISHAYLMKKAFLYDREIDEVQASPVNYLLAHWLIAKLSLTRIGHLILQAFKNVQAMDSEYRQSAEGSYGRRLAYIKFTRTYQAFLGYAVNLLDVIQEYVDYFNQACKELDPTYTYEGGTLVSALHDDEIFYGVYEILLRANMGRFTCVPLIRSGLEIQIIRRLLIPPETSRHKGKDIEAIKGFDLMRFLTRYSDRLGISFKFVDVEAIDRLYDWGSIAHHRGYRMAHCEMWYAANIAENILSLLTIDRAKFENNFDQIIDQLEVDGWVKITEFRS